MNKFQSCLGHISTLGLTRLRGATNADFDDVVQNAHGQANTVPENLRPHYRRPLARARLAISLVACTVLRWSASNGS